LAAVFLTWPRINRFFEIKRYIFGACQACCYDGVFVGGFMQRYGLSYRFETGFKRCIKYCVSAYLLGLACLAQAFPQGEIPLGQYQLLYSVLNSTSLPAEIAETYGFKRKADEVLVNITVQEMQNKRAVPVQLSGVAKNLMQQQRALVFREIKEDGAVYYLATLRTTEREVFHFLLNVTLPNGKVEKPTFTQELFVNP
jgi:hypothetical protein